MNKVTHIPHQHIRRIEPWSTEFMVVITTDPQNGQESSYYSSDSIKIDDKGIYGLFVKI